jgi:hypothetical protein
LFKSTLKPLLFVLFAMMAASVGLTFAFIAKILPFRDFEIGLFAVVIPFSPIFFWIVQKMAKEQQRLAPPPGTPSETSARRKLRHQARRLKIHIIGSLLLLVLAFFVAIDSKVRGWSIAAFLALTALWILLIVGRIQQLQSTQKKLEQP